MYLDLLILFLIFIVCILFIVKISPKIIYHTNEQFKIL
jgi:hypothetical protein